MNKIVVLKFGGSSLADNSKIKNVANRIIEFIEKGNKVIAVVSAQGKTTDNLLAEARQLSTNPSKRELDVLLSTGEQISMSKLSIILNELKYNTISLTGWQAGINTTNDYQDARILNVDIERIKHELYNDKIVLIAGFQGIDKDNNITTLGRGGSDTTAVAIAAATNADMCYIFSDVDGVYTADPNKIDNTLKHSNISYKEMINLSNSGAKVLHNRCIEIAEKYNIPIIAKSSFNNNEGTTISNQIEDNSIKGITKDDNNYLLSINKNTYNLNNIYKILLNNKIIYKELINDNESIKIVLNKEEYFKLLNISNLNENVKSKIQQISRISIIGNGIYTNDAIINKIVNYILENNINILNIEIEEIKVSITFNALLSDLVLRDLHNIIFA